MGKKQEKKTAKGRLDKFYWLAKEQGYRSRAAFKLVQLNKKYNFLENARCCIDLCAAPGGWLQVASKFMPPNSLIVGVDLVPIKPIPRCITFAEDINSYKCRDQLRQHLKDWKADVVIHDGAPNVGTAWVQDAYAQSELTLQSLRLAVEFLRAGGTFVTKVFRSKDYNNLLWVFNQLFKKVEATKPASSRNVSAEIFVVCQGYKNPARIDPKFLDPHHVFKDLDPTAVAGTESAVPESLKGTSMGNAAANVLDPKKHRKNREGYADGDYILFRSLEAIDFIKGSDVIGMLGSNNQITFKTDESRQLLKNAATTEDITASCEDLKVLGRKEFKVLMKWRKDLRIEMGLERSKQDLVEATETVEVEEMDEEEQIDDELARLNEEAARKARKERRKRNEARQKRILQLQLQMTTPMDIGMELTDDQLAKGTDDFFDLGEAEKKSKTGAAGLDDDFGDMPEDEEEESVTVVGSNDTDDDDEDDEEAKLRRLEGEMDLMYEQYQQKMQERDAKFRVKEARRMDPERDEWRGIRDDKDEEDDSDDSDGGYDIVQRRKEQEETFDTDDEEDEEDERAERAERLAAKRAGAGADASKKRKRARFVDGGDKAAGEQKKLLLNTLEGNDALAARQSREAAIWFDNPLFKDLQPIDVAAQPGAEEEDEEDEEGEEEDEEESDEDVEEDQAAALDDDDDFEVVPQDHEDDDIPDDEWDNYGSDEEAAKQKYIREHGLHTAEAVSLAQALVNKRVTKQELIDRGFSKNNFVDKSDLPAWFLDDERKHYKANIPITKEAVEALREKQRALDARPIKKIAEAKARKKMKAAQRLEKAQKKAEAINDNEDISEKEKASTINKLLANSVKAKQRKQAALVVAKGVNRGLKGRPKGVKGRYKMVDPRMKKEMRAQKRLNKKMGKKVNTSNKPRTPNGYGGR
ncbi:AdoMet-dependent rRNA methyltransferase spb1 [Thecaphora frezii]